VCKAFASDQPSASAPSRPRFPPGWKDAAERIENYIPMFACVSIFKQAQGFPLAERAEKSTT
jgi:hypothetical protein